MKVECDTRKPDFERAQNTASELLLKQKIDGLYIDVRNFSFDRRIIIGSLQNYAQITKRPIEDFICEQFNGCCLVKHPRCSLVLYDDNEPNECRKHWGIAHEIGHIYLDHKQDLEIEEKEAHFFAAQLIMPECVIHEIASLMGGSITAYDIYSHFNVSYKSAQKRIDTIIRRGCMSWAERDQLLLEKFRPFIYQLFNKKSYNSEII